MSGSDLFTGTLELLILRILSGEGLHGYAVGLRLRAWSDDILSVEEGVLYPALHRLERRGFLRAHWGKTDTGRRAKFYEISDEGRAALQRERERWGRFVTAVEGVLDERPS